MHLFSCYSDLARLVDWGWMNQKIRLTSVKIIAKSVQCPQSEEEYSVATICGFGDESHDLRVKTC